MGGVGGVGDGIGDGWGEFVKRANFLPFFDPQSGLQTKNRASCSGSRLRSEAEHPQGLTLRNRGSRLITTTPRQRTVSRLSERTCSRRATGLTALPLQVEEEESRRLIKHPWELEASWRCYPVAHARCAEQTMPPSPTLDRGG